jgi:hypothetical protein
MQPVVAETDVDERLALVDVVRVAPPEPPCAELVVVLVVVPADVLVDPPLGVGALVVGAPPVAPVASTKGCPHPIPIPVTATVSARERRTFIVASQPKSTGITNTRRRLIEATSEAPGTLVLYSEWAPTAPPVGD